MDETLTNILNLLQPTPDTNRSNQTFQNNDLQTLLLKFLLSGGLNQILNQRTQNNNAESVPSQPEKLRTIDLSNYQRLD